MSAQGIIFALHLWAMAGVPPVYGLDVWGASRAEGIDPYDLGALLISEHHGSYGDDSESTAGALGLYQVTKPWAWRWEERGGELVAGSARATLLDPEAASHVAASVVSYSIERHEDCGPNSQHTWVGHWKCGRSGRDSGLACGYAQRRWQRIRDYIDPPWGHI